MSRKGDTWNESETLRDALTLRKIHRITSRGIYNQTANYHTNIGFSADGNHLVFTSGREGYSAVFRADLPGGDITLLTEPTPHLGGYSTLHKQAGVTLGDGLGVAGSLCLAPKTGWAVYTVGRKLCAVNIYSLEERVLIDDFGIDWVAGTPSVDPTESSVILPTMLAHPDVKAGRRPEKGYMESFANGGMRMRLLEVPLRGGSYRIAYAEDGPGGAHSPHSPVDPDLILLDRDFPPKFWGGSDGKTNRIWTLKLSTGQLTELPNQDSAKFQVHCVWTWDGEAVLYHGKSSLGGHYIGVVSKTGQSLREYKFTKAPHYGHVSAMAGRPAIILDGNLTDDCLLWLYYDQEAPRVEIIARHATQWNALPGQFPHPHPLSDPTGRYISYNVGEKGRTDIFVVEV